MLLASACSKETCAENIAEPNVNELFGSVNEMDEKKNIFNFTVSNRSIE